MASFLRKQKYQELKSEESLQSFEEERKEKR
jgi:hypothetical protein